MESAYMQSTNEQIKKIWFKYTMEHYTVVQKGEVMSFAGKLKKFEMIMLNKINQTKKNKYHLFCLIYKI
jgi:adenine deaminase